jgi:hypothetical protein
VTTLRPCLSLAVVAGVVGAKAATFASAKNFSSWVGACPGEEESAGVNYSPRSPKGNRAPAHLARRRSNGCLRVLLCLQFHPFRNSSPMAPAYDGSSSRSRRSKAAQRTRRMFSFAIPHLAWRTKSFVYSGCLTTCLDRFGERPR